MSTAARKKRKRIRHAALDAGYTALAESLRFQHPRKTSTRRRPLAEDHFSDARRSRGWSALRRLFGRLG